jgi:peptidoglycan/LPS O-acetylase OafA/YrhL
VLLAGVDNLKLWNKGWARLGDIGSMLVVASLLGRAWLQGHPAWQCPTASEMLSAALLLGAGGLLSYAADPENPRARWLCAPWLRWCGIISYEWYLFHQPMIYWSRGGGWPG